MENLIKKSCYYIHSIYLMLLNFSNPIQIIKQFIFGVNKDSDVVKIKSPQLTFSVRSPMDVWSIKETFFDDFYHFEKLTKPSHGTIIDIGAGIGEFAIRVANSCKECNVIGFEPFPESFAFFENNILLNSLQNITAVKAAVTSHTGEMTMDISSGNPLQYRTIADGLEIDKEIVKTYNLIDFMNENTINVCEMLKLDCEGGEFDILLPLTTSELKRFKSIVMEYHDSLTIHNHKEIIDLLINAGFYVETEKNRVHDNLGYIYAQINK
jgi:FkbM family methyltransferase